MDDPVNPVQAEIEATNLIEWKAGPGLTRSDVGMEGTDSFAIYDSVLRDGPYEAKVELPTGVVLDYDVKYIAAWADGFGSGDPCRLVINQLPKEQDETQAILNSLQEQLGLDPELVAAWKASSDKVLAEGDSWFTQRSEYYRGGDHAGVSSSVEVSTSRSGSGFSVTIRLNWC